MADIQEDTLVTGISPACKTLLAVLMDEHAAERLGLRCNFSDPLTCPYSQPSSTK